VEDGATESHEVLVREELVVRARAVTEWQEARAVRVEVERVEVEVERVERVERVEARRRVAARR
jgi:hypothetical protein